MKEYYRIGETASLMGITTQTLRFYDKIGLVKPIKIDQTGYRYYAYEQFHFIDRIKYLQSLGMPLDDIKEVMLSKKVERLLPFLDQQKKVLEEEEKRSVIRSRWLTGTKIILPIWSEMKMHHVSCI